MRESPINGMAQQWDMDERERLHLILFQASLSLPEIGESHAAHVASHYRCMSFYY